MMGARLLSTAQLIASLPHPVPGSAQRAFTNRMLAPGAIAPDHSTSSDDSCRSPAFGKQPLQLCAWPGSTPLACMVVGRFVVLNPAAPRNASTSAVLLFARSTCPITAMSPHASPPALWQFAPVPTPAPVKPLVSSVSMP